MLQIKVEPALWYRACDEMGLLVIQDMPSLRPLETETDANGVTQTVLPDADQQNEFGRQLELLVNQLKSYPSIFTWVSQHITDLFISRTLTDPFRVHR